MTREKERLQRVIVIGATPEGIAAANKLGELGVAVTLIDNEPDIDQKLAGDAFRLQSGLRYNYAYRPGLIRIMRNSAIRSILPATIHSIKHTPQGFSVGVTQEQTFVDPETCTLCGKCADACQVTTSEGCRPITFHSRVSLPGRPFIDKRQQPLCQTNCPLGVNAQGYITLAAQGKYREALNLIRERNVLPGICGRICTHPCEDACRRGDFDQAVSIRSIKRFVADYVEGEGQQAGSPLAGPPTAKREERVAVIGSGPAGLAAAADLAGHGYRVTVFEKESKPGGMLRYGIGAHRLPEPVIEREIAYIQALGVEFATDQPIDIERELAGMQEHYQAVILGTGTWFDRTLGVPGEEMEGVEGCLAFLGSQAVRNRENLSHQVAVIGDGNSAFDLARTLTRMGAQVTLISWFPVDQIPADSDEVREACEEGVNIIDRTQVTAFLGEDNKLQSLACRKTVPGNTDANGVAWPVIDETADPFTLEFEHAIVAVGQVGGFDPQCDSLPCTITDRGFIAADSMQQTSCQGVYAVGDAVSGPSSVVHAMASGKRAADAIHAAFSGKPPRPQTIRPQEKPLTIIPDDIPRRNRQPMAERAAAERSICFAEVALGLNEEQAVQEAQRCLQCGSCSECFQCAEACGALQAINHRQEKQEIKEQGGVVIVADPSMAPNVKGEDVIRAYGPKAARSDVSDMTVRGFAAAGKAMLLLEKGNGKKTKGYGLAAAAPDAGLAPELRLGVFACRCNDSLGWLDNMSGYLNQLQATDATIVHTEELPAACVPEGIDAIIKTTREKGLTRIVLASCVCCPLNFVCSSCTDQRSRLKDGLFHGTGISRSMVETSNLRGEILRLVGNNPLLAIERFQGLLQRSIERAKILKPLPAVDRNYNFTAAVIGHSEATLTSAMYLAETGHDVFRFGTSKQPLQEPSPHPNIHSFTGWDVQALSGTIGDFQLLVESAEGRQVVRAGTVILGEKARRALPYTHQEGLPTCRVEPLIQEKKVSGIPFAYPCATSVPGLFLAEPSGINVSKLKKGAAAAIMAAAALPRGPRQSKGFTVVVDQKLCRGCGRCTAVCPYHAVTFHPQQTGGWHATVDEAICKGCGNCISVCPTGAADSPYRSREYLEQTLEEILSNQDIHEHAQ